MKRWLQDVLLLLVFVIGASMWVGCGPDVEPVPTRPPLSMVTFVPPPTPFVTRYDTVPPGMEGVTPTSESGIGGEETAASPTPTAAATATPIPTAVPTNTPAPTATVCIFDMQFIADITIPDNSIIEPNVAFVKTWRIRNSGNCAWTPGTSWVFSDGTLMNGPTAVSVPYTNPGETADISVTLIAPAAPGTYTGYWTLRAPTGWLLNKRFFVKIVVPGAPSVTSFTATAQQPYNGLVTLNWSTQFADRVWIYNLSPTGILLESWLLPANGQQVVGVVESDLASTRFRLVAENTRGIQEREQVITLQCAFSWFFASPPAICPAAAALASDATMQSFERGVMVWVHNVNLVYVLYSDNQSWDVFPNQYTPSDPALDPALQPPPGLYQPQAQLGLVWREGPDVFRRLGWAVNPPTTYRAFTQPGTDGAASLFIGTPVGNVWWLWENGRSWQLR